MKAEEHSAHGLYLHIKPEQRLIGRQQQQLGGQPMEHLRRTNTDRDVKPVINNSETRDGWKMSAGSASSHHYEHTVCRLKGRRPLFSVLEQTSSTWRRSSWISLALCKGAAVVGLIPVSLLEHINVPFGAAAKAKLPTNLHTDAWKSANFWVPVQLPFSGTKKDWTTNDNHQIVWEQIRIL